MTDTTPALHARFLRGLGVSPHRDAVRVGADAITYEAAHDRASRWAGALLAGVDERPRAIGVLAGKSIEAYVGVLAALYTGAAVVPLHLAFPPARTARMIELAGVSALIVDEEGAGVLARMPEVDVPVLAPAGGDVPAGRAVPVHAATALGEPRSVDATDTAYLLFTSGSTGTPKGVSITHGNTRHYFDLVTRRYEAGPDDVFSQTFDLNFDCAMFDLFCAWDAGATVQAVPAAAYRRLPEFLAERDVTVWFSTPSAIPLVRRTGGLGPGALPGLRLSLFAGEALKAADAADWQAAAPGSALENIYGPTELTVTVTGHRWRPDTSPSLCVNGLVPIGAVHEGHDHVLLGADGEPVADEGELCVTGPQLTAGYLDPADEPGRFVRRDGRTWYHTGDRVRRLDNGELIYLGRLDSQVQVQGWRVEPAEVEHALRSCPGVQDAVVVAVTADEMTELAVYYTGEPTPPAALAAALRSALPSGMVPKRYRHVEEFPLNSNRKVDRSRLAAAAAAEYAPRGEKSSVGV
jgi:amino acid adenylation domain-containing protein